MNPGRFGHRPLQKNSAIECNKRYISLILPQRERLWKPLFRILSCHIPTSIPADLTFPQPTIIIFICILSYSEFFLSIFKDLCSIILLIAGIHKTRPQKQWRNAQKEPRLPLRKRGSPIIYAVTERRTAFFIFLYGSLRNSIYRRKSSISAAAAVPSPTGAPSITEPNWYTQRLTP